MAPPAERRLVSDVEHGRAVLEVVDTALAAIGHAPSAEGPVFRCGPTTVRIRTVGARGSAYPPFSHLAATPDAADTDGSRELVVHVCDGDFPGGAECRPPRGFHRVRDGSRFVSVTDGPPTLAALRRADRSALSWIDDVAHEPPYLRFRPLAEIFSAWFPAQGMVLLHAAAVGDDDGAVLLVGNGGSGKSTTAVACSQAGIGFLADDFCLLEPGPTPRVHSIYRSAKLRRDSVHVVAGVDTTEPDPLDGDRYFLVDDAATVVSAPVIAIIAVSPAVDTATPRLRRVARDDALAHLLPTALKLPSGGDLAYRLWLRTAHTLARDVATYRLELTWDTARVVELVHDVLQGSGAEVSFT
jgi:hypothetical protein